MGCNCEEKDQAKKIIEGTLARIRQKILVLSGKGGVGKSTVATNIAMSLAQRGYKVGLLDVDIHGPSIPTLLNLEGKIASGTDDVLYPIEYNENLKVMSVGFVFSDEEVIIWRGPMKMNVITQFIKNVEWGELDYLVVDCPPGTGDESLSIAQHLENTSGAVVVTTPQEVSLNDARKTAKFCKMLGIPLFGILENMSGYICSKCNTLVHIFKSDGGKKLAEELEVPFLGSIPLDPKVVEFSDKGVPYVKEHKESLAGKTVENAVDIIVANVK